MSDAQRINTHLEKAQNKGETRKATLTRTIEPDAAGCDPGEIYRLHFII